MKHLQFLLFIFFFTSIAVSQEVNYKEIDSLLVLLNTKQEDSTRVNIYIEICNTYVKFDSKKADEYCEKLLQFSKRINYAKGLGSYYKIKAKNSFNHGKEQEEGIKNINKAILIFRNINDKKNYIISLQMKAAGYSNLGKSQESLQILLFALAESNRLNYTKSNGFLYVSLGRYYRRHKDYRMALLNFKKAIFYLRKANNNTGIIACYLDICNIYYDTHQRLQALKYVESAIKLESKLATSDELVKADLLNTKGQILINMKNYAAAIPYLNTALSISERIEADKSYITAVLSSLSEAYFGLKEYNKAISICNRGLKINDNLYNIRLNSILGKIYFELKDFPKAHFHQMESIKLINAKDFPYRHLIDTSELYEDLAKTEFALGNFKQAYLYQEKFTTLDKQTLLDEKKDRINELQTRFDVNEKEIALKNLTISKQKRDIEFQNEKNKLMTSSIVLGSTILLLFFISFGYKKNIKKNKVLKEQNQIITTKNVEIETTQGLLMKSLKEKEILLKEIHHRVKNNLQLVMSLLNIQARQGEYSDVNDFLEKGQSRIASMALIHQNLYETENLDRVDFQEYLENLIDNIKNTVIDTQREVNFKVVAKDSYFDIETSIPLGLIINELVFNAIKHAFPDNMEGEISIELESKDNQCFELTISDNGIGISNVINPKKSLGLELVNLLVAQLKGTIRLEAIFGTSYKINFQEISV